MSDFFHVFNKEILIFHLAIRCLLWQLIWKSFDYKYKLLTRYNSNIVAMGPEGVDGFTKVLNPC